MRPIKLDLKKDQVLMSWKKFIFMSSKDKMQYLQYIPYMPTILLSFPDLIHKYKLGRNYGMNEITYVNMFCYQC